MTSSYARMQVQPKHQNVLQGGQQESCFPTPVAGFQIVRSVAVPTSEVRSCVAADSPPAAVWIRWRRVSWHSLRTVPLLPFRDRAHHVAADCVDHDVLRDVNRCHLQRSVAPAPAAQSTSRRHWRASPAVRRPGCAPAPARAGAGREKGAVDRADPHAAPRDDCDACRGPAAPTAGVHCVHHVRSVAGGRGYVRSDAGVHGIRSVSLRLAPCWHRRTRSATVTPECRSFLAPEVWAVARAAGGAVDSVTPSRPAVQAPAAFSRGQPDPHLQRVVARCGG